MGIRCVMGLVMALAVMGVVPARAELVTVSTKAGPITVATQLASRFVGFINALPYTPRHVSCFAKSGHVTHSRHYAGAACDIDQRGWGLTSSPMYHIAALAASFGLRDGCTFRDCGHVDDGQITGGHRHYAGHYHGRHYAGRHLRRV